jgi:UDP-2,3-diacylglucosamine hydrolase
LSKSIYFLSDFHLGTPNEAESLVREKKIITFLESIENDTEEIFLMGDVFDFWYEYKTAVPKGFVRLMGKIASLTDRGIKIHYFIGNHDMWTFGYLESELGVILHKEPILIERNGKTLLIGHGDGLGPGDQKYKMLKKIFRFPFFQMLFGWIHPDLGIGIAQFWSRSSRYGTKKKEEFVAKEKEWLYIYCKEELLKNPKIDYFIFGHRHLALDLKIEDSNARYINLGDWINYFTYAKLDQNDLKLLTF